MTAPSRSTGGSLVAAPDKFRGTATAGEVAAAIVAGAGRAGWRGVALPMSDGGEGFLDALGGESRYSVVTGPNGDAVKAEWRLIDGATAVVEMARASGLALAGGAENNDPLTATTAGTGELVLAAVDAGARRVLVGCGGSATTDGGAGAVAAIGSVHRLRGAEVVVACDVATLFADAARIFGPQKGAGPAAVKELSARLSRLATRYADEFGVDVSGVVGSGAAGGLAGGLAALGATLVAGFDLVADTLGLREHIAGADLVVTGEGRLDAQSFEGKVVGGVIALARGNAPVLCIVGDVEEDVDVDEELVSLTSRFGAAAAVGDVTRLVSEVVESFLAAR
jgi:glycerate kinase